MYARTHWEGWCTLPLIDTHGMLDSGTGMVLPYHAMLCYLALNQI